MTAAERTLLLAGGVCAIEDILAHVYRLPVAKAINPLTTRGFEIITNRLSAALETATKAGETAAISRALNQINVDWVNLSEAGRKRVQDAVRATLGAAVPGNVAKVDRVLRITNSQLLPNVRKSALKKYNLGIGSSLTDTDKRTAAFLNKNTSFFVRDGYGTIHDAYSLKAQQIVASGLTRGLGSAEISASLAKAMPSAQRTPGYWNMISNAFSNRSRTYTQVHAFSDAGITAYKFEAVLDEATSKICKFMHGTTFSVPKNVRRIKSVIDDDDPESVKRLQPWVSEGKTDKGKSALFFNSGGSRTQVAGISGDSFTNPMSAAALDAVGVNMPPLHGNCRSTIVPV